MIPAGNSASVRKNRLKPIPREQAISRTRFNGFCPSGDEFLFIALCMDYFVLRIENYGIRYTPHNIPLPFNAKYRSITASDN